MPRAEIYALGEIEMCPALGNKYPREVFIVIGKSGLVRTLCAKPSAPGFKQAS